MPLFFPIFRKKSFLNQTTYVLKNRLHQQSFLNRDSFLNQAFLNRDSTVQTIGPLQTIIAMDPTRQPL